MPLISSVSFVPLPPPLKVAAPRVSSPLARRVPLLLLSLSTVKLCVPVPRSAVPRVMLPVVETVRFGLLVSVRSGRARVAPPAVMVAVVLSAPVRFRASLVPTARVMALPDCRVTLPSWILPPPVLSASESIESVSLAMTLPPIVIWSLASSEMAPVELSEPVMVMVFGGSMARPPEPVVSVPAIVTSPLVELRSNAPVPLRVRFSFILTSPLPAVISRLIPAVKVLALFSNVTGTLSPLASRISVPVILAVPEAASASIEMAVVVASPRLRSVAEITPSSADEISRSWSALPRPMLRALEPLMETLPSPASMVPLLVMAKSAVEISMSPFPPVVSNSVPVPESVSVPAPLASSSALMEMPVPVLSVETAAPTSISPLAERLMTPSVSEATAASISRMPPAARVISPLLPAEMALEMVRFEPAVTSTFPLVVMPAAVSTFPTVVEPVLTNVNAPPDSAEMVETVLFWLKVMSSPARNEALAACSAPPVCEMRPSPLLSRSASKMAVIVPPPMVPAVWRMSLFASRSSSPVPERVTFAAIVRLSPAVNSRLLVKVASPAMERLPVALMFPPPVTVSASFPARLVFRTVRFRSPVLSMKIPPEVLLRTCRLSTLASSASMFPPVSKPIPLAALRMALGASISKPVLLSSMILPAVVRMTVLSSETVAPMTMSPLPPSRLTLPLMLSSSVLLMARESVDPSWSETLPP